MKLLIFVLCFGLYSCQSAPKCYEQGFCQGSLVSSTRVANEKECHNLCHRTSGCKWWNFDGNNLGTCIITEDCNSLDPDCTNAKCVYGQVECEREMVTYILAATGVSHLYHIDTIELINTQTWETCTYGSNENMPSPYPYLLQDAFGMTYNGKAVICTGWDGHVAYADCFSYDPEFNRWDLEPFRSVPSRSGASSVEIRPGEWLILGGYSYGDFLRETYIFKDGVFTDGPMMPEHHYYASCCMLNSTTLFVATGQVTITGSLDTNWLLNIDTWTWTPIARRTLGLTYGHDSGTFYNSTAGEHQIANIGENGIEVYSPGNDEWQSGFALPLPNGQLKYSATIQEGFDSFYLVGGYDGLGYPKSVYRFSEAGFEIVSNAVLTDERCKHVAIKIDTNKLTCS